MCKCKRCFNNDFRAKSKITVRVDLRVTFALVLLLHLISHRPTLINISSEASSSVGVLHTDRLRKSENIGRPSNTLMDLI